MSSDTTDAPHAAAAAEGLSEQELAEIEARANAADPPPWPLVEERRPPSGNPHLRHSNYDERLPLDHEGCDVWPWDSEENMIFAYRARDDVPRLIEEIRRLRRALQGGDGPEGEGE